MYERGGESFVNAHVDEIIMKNGKAAGVRVCKATSLEGSRASEEKPEMTELYAPIIINATGMHTLYNKLLPQELPIVKEFKDENKCIPSYGHNYLFVAIKGMYEGIFRHSITIYLFHSCAHYSLMLLISLED